MQERFKGFVALVVLIATFILILFSCSIRATIAQSSFVCTPRMVTITVGDGTPGNPQQTYNTELGCVYNVFTSVENLLPVETPVIFSNVNYFSPNGIVKVSGNGKIIGYQITRLIHTQGVLYIIQFDADNKQVRLHPYEFETE